MVLIIVAKQKNESLQSEYGRYVNKKVKPSMFCRRSYRPHVSRQQILLQTSEMLVSVHPPAFSAFVMHFLKSNLKWILLVFLCVPFQLICGRLQTRATWSLSVAPNGSKLKRQRGGFSLDSRSSLDVQNRTSSHHLYPLIKRKDEIRPSDWLLTVKS